MDKEHKHHLRENDLANWIAAQYADWIGPNSNWLSWALIGVLIVVLVLMGTARLNQWNQAAAWKQYYAALNSGQAEADLEALADSSRGVVGVQARLALGQTKLREGCEAVFTDKTKAVAALEKAVFVFQKILKSTSDKNVLQQAEFCLGQSYETLAASRKGDDLAKAETEYKKVAEKWKGENIGKRAERQLQLFGQAGTKKFFELAAAQVIKKDEEDANSFRVNIDPKTVDLKPSEIDLRKVLGEPEPKDELPK